MLANILPGLREIRGPLAAGYLFIVSGWILLHDQVNVSAGASSTVDALRGLQHQLGTGALAAALSFVAYIVGALWEPLAAWLERALWRVETVRSSRRTGISDSIRAGRSPGNPQPGVRLSSGGWKQLWTVSQRLFIDVDDVVREQLRISEAMAADEIAQIERLRAGAEEMLQAVRAANKELHDPGSTHIDAATLLINDARRTYDAWMGFPSGDASADEDAILESLERLAASDELFGDVWRATLAADRDAWWIREAGELVTSREGPRYLLAREGPQTLVYTKEPNSFNVAFISLHKVVQQVLDELPLTARRLVAEEEKLFLEVDRMQGEINFRFTLAVPVTLAAIAVGVGLSIPIWAKALFIVAGIGAGRALLVDGWRRDRERKDLLVGLLAIGKAKSVTFERLSQRAKAIRDDRGPVAERDARDALAASLKPHVHLLITQYGQGEPVVARAVVLGPLSPMGLSGVAAAADVMIQFNLASGTHGASGSIPILEPNGSQWAEEPPYLNVVIRQPSDDWPPPEGDHVTATVSFSDVRRAARYQLSKSVDLRRSAEPGLVSFQNYTDGPEMRVKS